MKRIFVLVALVVAMALPAGVAGAAPADEACWGQATKAFAQMGEMGEHASGFETPRLGLRNLARQLHEQGILEDDTMQALGAFVADELGLEVEACS